MSMNKSLTEIPQELSIKAEDLSGENGWGGSDIVGGSSREKGTGLTWQRLRDIGLEVCSAKKTQQGDPQGPRSRRTSGLPGQEVSFVK